MTENPDLEDMLKNIPSEKDKKSEGPTPKERISQLEKELKELKTEKKVKSTTNKESKINPFSSFLDTYKEMWRYPKDPILTRFALLSPLIALGTIWGLYFILNNNPQSYNRDIEKPAEAISSCTTTFNRACLNVTTIDPYDRTKAVPGIKVHWTNSRTGNDIFKGYSGEDGTVAFRVPLRPVYYDFVISGYPDGSSCSLKQNSIQDSIQAYLKLQPPEPGEHGPCYVID